MKIDGIDKKIIQELANNSRTPILEISRKIGISGAQFIKELELEDSGLISGHHLKLNPKVLGYSTLGWSLF